jgi:hypothetical protein
MNELVVLKKELSSPAVSGEDNAMANSAPFILMIHANIPG